MIYHGDSPANMASRSLSHRPAHIAFLQITRSEGRALRASPIRGLPCFTPVGGLLHS